MRISDWSSDVCSSDLQFKASFTFPESIEAGLRVGHLGNRSVRYEIGLFKESSDEVAALGSFVHVFVARATMKAVPIPDGLLQAVGRLQKEKRKIGRASGRERVWSSVRSLGGGST